MRPSVALSLLVLAGCTTMREAAGKYADFAEKGIELKAGDSAKTTTSETLPGGLVGDGKARSYAEPPPRSS